MDNHTLLPNISSDSLEGKLLLLSPGTTKDSDAKNILGTPAESLNNNDGTNIFTYNSSDVSRPNIVYTKDGVVTFVQVVFNPSYKLSTDDVVKLFGQPEDKAYSSHSHDSLVYSYPSKGIIFHIDGKTANVFMVQKYKPMTLTEYKASVGKDFSAQPFGDIFDKNLSITSQLPNLTTPPTPIPIYKRGSFLNFSIIILIVLLVITVSIIIKRIRAHRLLG